MCAKYDNNNYKGNGNGNGHKKYETDTVEIAPISEGTMVRGFEKFVEASTNEHPHIHEQAKALTSDKEQDERIENAVHDLLGALNINAEDPNYMGNPKDVAKAFMEYLANGHGHKQDESISTQNPSRGPERYYDDNFVVTPEYKESLPDLQNGPSSLISGKPVSIPQVGIHNFRLPIRYLTRDGETVLLETSVTGTVSLEAFKKGINMSRIMRTFYEHRDEAFSLDYLSEILRDYNAKIGGMEARLTLRFRYPILNESLRSGLLGYQYYDVALESRLDATGMVRNFIHFDFVYSSTCPCSYELSQHAIEERNIAAVPHSQRSVARVSIETNGFVWIEDLRDLCLEALKTETQVMVKREDEQAFAELNAANLKFVEDAVRLLYEVLESESQICDFKVIASHQESLHSHDAVAVLVKGIDGGFTAEIEPSTMTSMIHKS